MNRRSSLNMTGDETLAEEEFQAFKRQLKTVQNKIEILNGKS